MKARNIMTSPVIKVKPDADIQGIAQTLMDNCVSAVPVVDDNGKMQGIVSEGDLFKHVQAGTGTPRRRSWWLSMLTEPNTRARDYIKEHGKTASDVMTKFVMTVTEDAPLPEIARILEKNGIKRVPVVRDGKVVGIVSRANLLQGIAHPEPAPLEHKQGVELRDAIANEVQHAGLQTTGLNIIVTDGSVQLWGTADSHEEIQAINLIAKNAAHGQNVENNLRVLSVPLV